MLLSKIESSPPAATLAYCFSSMSMTLVNKYVVLGNEWNLNFFYLAVQVFNLRGSSKNQTFVSSADWLTFDRWYQGLPISLLLAGMIYTSIQALQFLAVPVYTIFKNLTIIVIAYGEALGFGGSSGHGVSRLALLSFALMGLSSVVAAWTDIQSVVGDATGDATARDVGVTISALNRGYFWMDLNIFCAAAYALSNRRTMVRADLKSIDVMFYNNLLFIPTLVVCSALLEDWSAPNLQRNFPAVGRQQLVAILMSYCTPWYIRATSSTTYAMVGALNKLPVAVLGIVFFASPVTVGGTVAILIGVLSGVVYTWTKTREMAASQGQYAQEKPILPLNVVRQKS